LIPSLLMRSWKLYPYWVLETTPFLLFAGNKYAPSRPLIYFSRSLLIDSGIGTRLPFLVFTLWAGIENTPSPKSTSFTSSVATSPGLIPVYATMVKNIVHILNAFSLLKYVINFPLWCLLVVFTGSMLRNASTSSLFI